MEAQLMSSNEDRLSSAAHVVQEQLNTYGLQFHVQELPTSTRSAQDAANSIGCTVGQIAKSLVFRMRQSGEGLLVIASGSNRVNESALGEILGQGIEIAEAEWVRKITGFSIGGIPPVGHQTRLNTILDEDLRAFEIIWAAAGTPHAVFRLTPSALEQITGGRWFPIT
jgi:prolyl-tRNA editing enzyme YbaK/EbsC (Cys-tRNA(Pro) deacylase)